MCPKGLGFFTLENYQGKQSTISMTFSEIVLKFPKTTFFMWFFQVFVGDEEESLYVPTYKIES